MNLYEPVMQKITELGPTKAAKFFGVSAPTIHAWKKKPEKIPLFAVQKMHDEVPAEAANDPAPVLPTTVQAPVQAVGDRTPPAKTSISNTELIAFVGETQNRLDKLENFARLLTDPDLNRPAGSLLRPISPPQRTSPAAQMVAPSNLDALGVNNDLVDPSPLVSQINRPYKQPITR